jgi:hypothetical protein
MKDRKFQPTSKDKQFNKLMRQMGDNFKRRKFTSAVLACNQPDEAESSDLPLADTSDDE